MQLYMLMELNILLKLSYCYQIIFLFKFLIAISKKVKSSAGFDAIAQALESIISKNQMMRVWLPQDLLYYQLNYTDFLKNQTWRMPQMISPQIWQEKRLVYLKQQSPHAVSYPFTFYLI